MSMYADYLRERTADSILETETGFATYRFMDDGKSVYIVDIYTKSGHRGRGCAAALADRIASEAKDRGCTEMIGSVQPSTNGSTQSLKALLAYGMVLKAATQDFIVLRKDL